MNILVIGKPSANLAAMLTKSKYVSKIYTALNKDFTDFPNIEYRNFDELIRKSLALKIDIALNLDKTLIQSGIAEVFETARINLISVNKKWLNLETSRLSAKKLLNHYQINTPQIIKVPLNFPVMIKTDSGVNSGVNFGVNKRVDFIANSIQDVVSKMEELEGAKTFFEEFIEGAKLVLYIMWDKKNIKFFHSSKNLTEVQLDRLDLLKTKLNFMFSDEKADFAGIFAANLLWHKNDWFINEFDMGTEIPLDLLSDMDFVYLLNSAIYQKLNEI